MYINDTLQKICFFCLHPSTAFLLVQSDAAAADIMV